jgi:hypothetical protein
MKTPDQKVKITVPAALWARLARNARRLEIPEGHLSVYREFIATTHIPETDEFLVLGHRYPNRAAAVRVVRAPLQTCDELSELPPYHYPNADSPSHVESSWACWGPAPASASGLAKHPSFCNPAS